MAKKEKIYKSAKEAFDAFCVEVTWAKDHGRNKEGDTSMVHPSTAKALRVHKVIK